MNKKCYCIFVGIIGIILLILKWLFMDKNFLGVWNTYSWAAAVLVVLGFFVCGYVACKNGKNNNSNNI